MCYKQRGRAEAKCFTRCGSLWSRKKTSYEVLRRESKSGRIVKCGEHLERFPIATENRQMSQYTFGVISLGEFSMAMETSRLGDKK